MEEDDQRGSGPVGQPVEVDEVAVRCVPAFAPEIRQRPLAQRDAASARTVQVCTNPDGTPRDLPQDTRDALSTLLVG